MGLDAVVFRNVHRLEETFGHGLFEVDETTGEAILKPNVNLSIPRDFFFAIQKRLGNLTEIEWLRETIGNILKTQDSLILGRVVYSGSHSGDSIMLDELPRLREEIDLLRGQNNVDLHEFVNSMESLLNASDAEHNPIVFV